MSDDEILIAAAKIRAKNPGLTDADLHLLGLTAEAGPEGLPLMYLRETRVAGSPNRYLCALDRLETRGLVRTERRAYARTAYRGHKGRDARAEVFYVRTDKPIATATPAANPVFVL